MHVRKTGFLKCNPFSESIIPDICNMYILLIAATPFEIQSTIDFWGSSAESFPEKENIHIEYLITGIGSLCTTYSLTRHIGSRRPELIIQGGIAGCFTDKAPGQVLAVSEEVLGDLGVWEEDNFKSIADLRLIGKDSFPFFNGLLQNPYDKLLAMTKLEQVRAITVNEISTDKNRIQWYQQNLRPVVESMEGGSLHYVCLQEKIPFLQLRSVSNLVGIRDKSQWDIPAALRGLNQTLIGLLKELTRYKENNLFNSLVIGNK